MLEGGANEGLPLIHQLGRQFFQALGVAHYMKSELGLGWDGKKRNGHRHAAVVRCLSSLVVVLLMGRHDLYAQLVAMNLREDVPEGETTTKVVAVTRGRLTPEQEVDHGKAERFFSFAARFTRIFTARFVRPALGFSPQAFGQLLGGAAYHALDARARQIGQTVGPEEGEAVFQRVFVAQAGGERGGGNGMQ